MPNTIKYSESIQTLSLKKGNFWIGTGDVGKGPTETTGYWNGITPPNPNLGYTLYINKASQGPSIICLGSASELISLTNVLSGQSFVTIETALNWYNTQTDKMVFNLDYPAMVTNGLVLNLDAGFTPSYPKGGTSFYDLGPSGYNGSLIDGPIFDSEFGGTIDFDGDNDFMSFPGTFNATTAGLTGYHSVEMWIRPDVVLLQEYSLFSCENTGVANLKYYITPGGVGSYFSMSLGASTFATSESLIPPDSPTWYNVVFVFDTDNIPKIYVDGYLTESSNSGVSSAFDGGTAPIQFGRFQGGTPYDGKLSVLRVYNRALSASEILQNYNAAQSRYIPAEVTPNPVNWADISSESGLVISFSSQQILGINQTITLKISYTLDCGLPNSNGGILKYFISDVAPINDNGTLKIDGVPISMIDIFPNGTLNITNNKYLTFSTDSYCFGSNSQTVSIINLSDSDTVLDTFGMTSSG